MPYFGSSIEGAANTAWQADNSIRDRLIANAWRINEALARNRQMEEQDMQAQLAAMRMAENDAAANYFRGLNAIAQAAQMQRDQQLLAQQLAAQRRAEELQREQLQYQKNIADKQMEQAQREIDELGLVRQKMPDLLAPHYFEATQQSAQLEQYIKQKQDELMRDIEGARRLGGYFNPQQRKLELPRATEMTEPAKKLLPQYARRIESTLAELSDAMKRIEGLKRKISELQSSAMQFGFVFGNPTESGEVPVTSVYSPEPRNIRVGSPQPSGPKPPRFRYDPLNRKLIPVQ